MAKSRQHDLPRRIFESFTGFCDGELDFMSPSSMLVMANFLRVGSNPMPFIEAVEDEPDLYWLKHSNIGPQKMSEIKLFLNKYKEKLESEILNKPKAK